VTPVPDTLSDTSSPGCCAASGSTLSIARPSRSKVPAEAEIVLEGHVSLDEYGDEGPYGDHTGYYNAVEQFPVFRLSAITMRRDPIYLSTFTGRPPDEPSILGEALNEVFVAAAPTAIPPTSSISGCRRRAAPTASPSSRSARPIPARRSGR